MTRDHILGEIHRTASANGGTPLGWRRFESETGIRLADWSKHWARWAEAIQEAGYTPNGFIAAFDDSALLERYATLCRSLIASPRSAT